MSDKTETHIYIDVIVYGNISGHTQGVAKMVANVAIAYGLTREEFATMCLCAASAYASMEDTTWKVNKNVVEETVRSKNST